MAELEESWIDKVIFKHEVFSLLKLKDYPYLWVYNEKDTEIATLYSLELMKPEMKQWIEQNQWKGINEFMWYLRMLGLIGRISDE